MVISDVVAKLMVDVSTELTVDITKVAIPNPMTLTEDRVAVIAVALPVERLIL